MTDNETKPTTVEQALARYADCSIDSVDSTGWPGLASGGTIFQADGVDYLVCTDSEADAGIEWCRAGNLDRQQRRDAQTVRYVG